MSHTKSSLAWFIERFSQVIESTNGKDKLLKLIQCICKLTMWKHHRNLILPKLLQAAASEISSARKLFRLGRTIRNLHWIRLILNGGDGGEPDLLVRILRLTAFVSNGCWFLCDHSVWLTALRRVVESRGDEIVDPLLPLNRVCAVVMQGALGALNIRKTLFVLSEIGRTHKAIMSFPLNITILLPHSNQLVLMSDSKRNTLLAEFETSDNEDVRAAAGLVREQTRQLSMLIALVPHLVKNFGDIVSCWDFGLKLQLPKAFINWCGIFASLSGLYIESSRAARRERDEKAQLTEAKKVGVAPPIHNSNDYKRIIRYDAKKRPDAMQSTVVPTTTSASTEIDDDRNSGSDFISDGTVKNASNEASDDTLSRGDGGDVVAPLQRHRGDRNARIRYRRDSISTTVGGNRVIAQVANSFEGIRVIVPGQRLKYRSNSMSSLHVDKHTSKKNE